MVSSSTTVIMSFSSFLAVLTTAVCVVLLFAFSRSRKQQRSRSIAVASLVFSNGLIGAVSLPMWIYLIYDYSENPTRFVKTKLNIAYNVIDITLNVATCLQLLIISYEQLRIKAFQTQSKVNTGTKCYLLVTWIVGLVVATLHSLSSAKGIITAIIIIVLILVPVLFITICFVCMLIIKSNPEPLANQQYAATTKTGLIVLSCFVCLVPSAVLMLLLHTRIMVPNPVLGYVVVLLRYVSPLSTTVIHGYKSMAFEPSALSCEKQGEINEVYEVSITEMVVRDDASESSLVV